MYWLVGSHGTLGSAVYQLLEASGIPFVDSNSEVDITDRAALADFTKGLSISAIINCAAYTAVRDCERNVEHAFNVNAEGVRHLAEIAEAKDAHLVHVSTDYVFDGTSRTPYREDSPTNPLNVYGASKLKGEDYVRAAACRWTVVRTSWLFGDTGENFVSTILSRLRDHGTIRVVDDQLGNPTYAGDLAQALLALARSAPGMYHVTNHGIVSWFGFAQEVVQQASELGYFDAPAFVVPVSSRDYSDVVARPPFSALSGEKAAAVLGARPRPWQAALSDFMAQVLKRAMV
jgi:dTDP-4-dehydrorhamnose reductase